MPQHRFSAIFANHPRSAHPWWIVPNVLKMAASQLGYPVVFIVFVVAGNGAVHVYRRLPIVLLTRTF
jgi:hypothetical protein